VNLKTVKLTKKEFALIVHALDIEFLAIQCDERTKKEPHRYQNGRLTY